MTAHHLKTLFVVASVALLTITTGCSAKAKVERHVKRADAYFEKGDFESARLEYLNAFRMNQNDPHVAQRLGESFIQKGDIRSGGQLLMRAQELQPTNTIVRLKLGSIYLLVGDHTKARQEAEEVLKLSPANSEALVLLANSASNTNEVAAIRRRLQEIRQANPQNSSIDFALGILAQKVGDFSGAQSSFEKAVAANPKSSKDNLALANLLSRQGETNRAEIYYKAAVEASAEKSVERLAYAEFLTRCGRLPEAKAFLEQTVAKTPDFSAAWNALTQIAFSQNDAEHASEYIAKVLAKEPTNHDALFNQARLSLGKREFKTASTQFEKITEAFPRDSQAYYQLALSQIGGDEAAKALVSLDKALGINTNLVDAAILRCRLQLANGDLNNSIPELARIVRTYPHAEQAHYLLAAAYRQRNALEDAIAVYKNMTKLFPKDPQPLQLLGTIYIQQKNYAAARQAYESALKINPDFLGAIDDLIELDIMDQKFDVASRRVAGYVQKYPDKPMPRLLEAKVLFAQKKNDEAEAAVKKAIELDPEFTIAHKTLADFYVRSQQTDRAIAQFESMLKKNSKDAGSLLQLGMLYETKKEFKKAQTAYESVLKISPNSTVALNNLAYLLGERVGDLDTAVQLARKARDLSPYDPFLADTFGWMLCKKGDYAQAVLPLQQAVQEFNQRGIPQPEVQYHLGLARYMTGDTAAAEELLTKAVQSTNVFSGKDQAGVALTILKVDPAKPSSDTVPLLQKAIAANPSDVLAVTKLAQVYETQSNWDQARNSYEKALEHNPKSTLVLSQLAKLYSGPLKNPARALDYAKQAWTIAQTGDLGAVVGPIGYTAGDYAWAYGPLLEAQRAQPGNASLAYYSGMCAFALGKTPQAQDSLTRAAQGNTLDPRMRKASEIVMQLCGMQLGTVPLAQSEAAAANLQAVDPGSPSVLLASGLAAEQKGDFNGARQRYESILAAHPGFIPAQRQLALLLSEKLVDDEKALELGTALRRNFPEDLALAKALGKVAYRKGDYAEAARLLKLASSKYAKDSDFLFHLGLAQFNLGDKSAKRSLSDAVALDSNSSLAADAKQALAQLK